MTRLTLTLDVRAHKLSVARLRASVYWLTATQTARRYFLVAHRQNVCSFGLRLRHWLMYRQWTRTAEQRKVSTDGHRSE
jgi:hypothetical protein